MGPVQRLPLAPAARRQALAGPRRLPARARDVPGSRPPACPPPVQGVHSVAYSPLGHSTAELLSHPAVLEVAAEAGRTPAQVRQRGGWAHGQGPTVCLLWRTCHAGAPAAPRRAAAPNCRQCPHHCQPPRVALERSMQRGISARSILSAMVLLTILPSLPPPPQVLLKWNVQRGVAVIPKAGSQPHVAENAEGLFAWRLTWDQKARCCRLAPCYPLPAARKPAARWEQQRSTPALLLAAPPGRAAAADQH